MISNKELIFRIVNTLISKKFLPILNHLGNFLAGWVDVPASVDVFLLWLVEGVLLLSVVEQDGGIVVVVILKCNFEPYENMINCECYCRVEKYKYDNLECFSDRYISGIME